MADTSSAIILGASITSSIALVGVIVTVAAGGRQQRKTLEHTAEQARLAREADAQRDAAAAAQRRYERARAILEPYISLAREMKSAVSGWQIVLAPLSPEEAGRQHLERVDAVWKVAEQRRGDFEIEPGLEEIRSLFGRLTGAYNVFANAVQNRIDGSGWAKVASDKTTEVLELSDAFTEMSRSLLKDLAGVE